MRKNLLLPLFALLLLAGAIAFGLRHSAMSPPEKETPAESSPRQGEAPSTAMDSATAPRGEILFGEEEVVLLPSLRDWEEEGARDGEVQRMQEILDTNQNDEILAQAEFLVESASEVRRYAAIAPLRWVSNPAAIHLLAKLVGDPEPEIALEALSAIGGILDTIATEINTSDEGDLEVTEDLELDEFYESATEAMLACTDQDSLDVLMFKVSTMDVSLSLPIFLEILEQGQDWQQETALEFMDNVTHGDGVTNREEAYLWLKNANGEQRVDP
ncbi:MAG: hypothetical protein ACI4SG_04325 [Oligosphaeraceae bacterium]